MGSNSQFCTVMSLQVMKEQRRKLCQDTLNKDPELYMGLYQADSSQRNLFLQYYLLCWFDNHWNTMLDLLDRYPEFSNDEKKAMILHYAEYFAKMLDMMSESGGLAKLAIPNLLRLQKESIAELISLSSQWERKNNELKLLFIQHREQFKRMLEPYIS